MIQLSEYAKKIEISARSRYVAKIDCLKIDPYCLDRRNISHDLTSLPGIDYTDIAFYLVYGTSYITAKELKAKKSLESYKNFLDGWVREVTCATVEGKQLALGKVAKNNTDCHNLLKYT